MRRARDLGFSIEQVRALLNLADHKEQSCEAVDAIAHEHLVEVKRKLADLAALRRELDSLIGQCRHGTIAECRILEALVPGDAIGARQRVTQTASTSPNGHAPWRKPYAEPSAHEPAKARMNQ